VVDYRSPRLRGRAGVRRRERILARDPVCVECAKLSIYRPTDEVDHIVPLHRGGPDTDANLQGLCSPCHEAKTLAEQGHGVSNHPEWLERSLIPLVILTGPPCAGKSTCARMEASASDLVVELDDIMTTLDPAYRHWTGDRNKDRLDEAIRLRNRMLGSLSDPSCPYPRAWFIVSAPSPVERAWWHTHLGGELRLLHPGVAECIRRAKARGTPGAIEGIHDWERRSRLPWTPQRSKVAIDADGWPTA